MSRDLAAMVALCAEDAVMETPAVLADLQHDLVDRAAQQVRR
jgi:hypothetical protein